MTPLEITPILPSTLHHYWNFLEPGLHEIKVGCKSDWEVEDHYAGIYNGRIEAFMMHRAGRQLGFFDGYPAPVALGKQALKYFLYAVYSIPPAGRIKEDQDLVVEDRCQTIEFIKHRARELNCKFIETVSPRHFHTRLGFEEYARMYRLTV